MDFILKRSSSLDFFLTFFKLPIYEKQFKKEIIKKIKERVIIR